MGKLSDLILGTPEQRAAKKKRELKLKEAERRAYYKAYTKTRVARARKRGAKAGRGGGGISGSFAKAQSFLGSEVVPRLENLADIGVGDIGVLPKSRRKPKKTRKAKGTKIKINGTTITIAKVTKKKKRKAKKSEPSIWGW
jgi:hypothetical protein